LIRWQTKYAFAIPLQEYVWSLMESTWKKKRSHQCRWSESTRDCQWQRPLSCHQSRTCNNSS
jgi:hypothetical protein